MEEKYGNVMEVYYKNGPTKNRSCTDTICLGIFIGFIVICLGISMYGLSAGNPNYLAQPFDPDHQPCGVGKLSKFPYIYFVAPSQHTLYRTVCVSECPSTKQNDNMGQLKCSPNSVVKSCKTNLSIDDANERILVYDTVPYTGRVCLPTVSQYFDKVNIALNANKASQAFGDLRNTWMIICFSGAFAILIGYVVLKLISKYAKQIIWTFVGIFIASQFLLGIFFFHRYHKLSSTEDISLSNVHSSPEQLTNQVSRKDTDPSEYLWVSIIFFLLAIFSSFIIYLMRKRIQLCIVIIHCSAEMIEDAPEVQLVPIIFYIISFLYFMFWVVIATNLYSCGSVTSKPHSLPFGQFEFSSGIRNIAIIHFFSLIWNSTFLIGACQFIVLGVASFWYFQEDKNQVNGGGGQNIRGQSQRFQLNKEKQYVKSSIMLFIKYHIGTVAFGSIFVAFLDALRVTFEFMHNIIQEHKNSENSLLKSILKCLNCIVVFFESFLQFINKNSYVMTCMTGKAFRQSTKDVYNLIERRKQKLKNSDHLYLQPGVGELFEFLGNLSITMISTLFCYFIITHASYYTNRLHSPVFPTICFTILSYCVASYFMSLLGTAADGIIVLSFIDHELTIQEDQEGQGEEQKPKFEPRELTNYRLHVIDHCKKHKM